MKVKIERRTTPAEVWRTINVARTQCQILMAHGDGELKRKLGLSGEYRKHREAAAKDVIDTAFVVSVALDIIKNPGFPFLGNVLWRRFLKRQKFMNEAIDKLIEEPKEEAPLPPRKERRAAERAARKEKTHAEGV